jgi:hypothetical protein
VLDIGSGPYCLLSRLALNAGGVRRCWRSNNSQPASRPAGHSVSLVENVACLRCRRTDKHTSTRHGWHVQLAQPTVIWSA